MNTVKIKDAIQQIYRDKYILPPVQREFVWKQEQIVKLFDSLMQKYPIGSLLYWTIDREMAKQLKLYKFVLNYDERSGLNTNEIQTFDDQDIVAVLDGQQRLTALYIGLKGSIRTKQPRRSWKDEGAYQERFLYINLCKPDEGKLANKQMKYDLRFLTKREAEQIDDGQEWYKVGDILNIADGNALRDKDKEVYKKYYENQEKVFYAQEIFYNLYHIVNEEGILNYFSIASGSIDEVLNIFVRSNSGGTTLGYSDLLFSFVATKWDDTEFKEELSELLKELNKTGEGFNLDKDIILKACLVLSDAADISYKVENFIKGGTLDNIKTEWDKQTIQNALRVTMKLIKSWGYSRDNMTSNNLIIPIAYYIKMHNLTDNFVTSTNYDKDRKLVKKWFVRSLLRRVFSFSPDGVLLPIRDIIRENPGEFPLGLIIDNFKVGNRSIVFDEESLENLLDIKYVDGDCKVVMSIINEDWMIPDSTYHIDHMFPRSKITKSALSKTTVKPENTNKFIEKKDTLANLQMLVGTSNVSKKDMDYEEWVLKTYDTDQKRETYYTMQRVPRGISYKFENFLDFIEKREELLLEELRKQLM